MTPNWSPEDLAVVQMRIKANLNKKYPPAFKEDETDLDMGAEATLQKKIVAHAKGKGWPCLSFRQSKKARGYLEPGWPDLTLCLPEGRVIFIELKSKTGVWGGKQRLIFNMLRHLEHEIYIVKSFKRYMEIIGKEE